jgi:hypothetical protein
MSVALLQRVADEVGGARKEIRQGNFQRSMAAVTGLSAVASGFEAYVQHRRGAFSHWLMWTPVVLTPPTVVMSGAALVSEKAARTALPFLSAVTLADGVIGFLYHLRGIRRMPGGFSVGQYNVVMGPPIFAPLLTCTVGVAGLLTGLLRRKGHALSPRQMKERARRAGLVLGTKSSRDFAERVAHGRFQQAMAAAAAGFAVLAGGEAYFEHLRGSFNQRIMWTPVWVTPPMVAAGVGAVLSKRVAETVLPAASLVTFADGMLGFALHLRGIKRMPGGLHNMKFNVTMGPPAFAPLLLCAVGLMGMVASLLRRRER